jgi:hypothetical protein
VSSLPCLISAESVVASNTPPEHEIVTVTAVTSPKDRSRKKVGVGEDVILTFYAKSLNADGTTSLAPHKATWTISGPGKIEGDVKPVKNTSTITFTAPDTTKIKTAATATTPAVYDSEKTTIVAECEEDAGSATVSFTTIRPDAVNFKLRHIVPLELNGFPLQHGIVCDVIVTPADVNFQKITIAELGCVAKTTGFFKKFDNTPAFVNHTPTPVPYLTMDTHIDGTGTVNNTVGDNIKMTTFTTLPPPVPKTNIGQYAAGTFTWTIPTKYFLNGDQGVFANAVYVAEIKVDQNQEATLSSTKNSTFLFQNAESGQTLPFPPPQPQQ